MIEEIDQEDLLESEYLKSQDFTNNMREVIDRETWGKGLPKIYGENNIVEGRYEIYAHYKNGEKILLAYNKDNMSITLPNDFNNNQYYEGHWKDSYSQKETSDSLENLIELLNTNKELHQCKHKLYITSFK